MFKKIKHKIDLDIKDKKYATVPGMDAISDYIGFEGIEMLYNNSSISIRCGNCATGSCSPGNCAPSNCSGNCSPSMTDYMLAKDAKTEKC